MTRLFRLAVLTAISTFALIALGGITRISASGLGCEDDWPLCQGKPYPPLNAMAIVEYLHRTAAASVALLVFLTAIAAWTTGRALGRAKLAATASLLAIVAQGLLGAAGSRWELPNWIASAHLALAMIFFAATLLTVAFVASDWGRPAWIAQIPGRGDGHPDSRFTWIAAAGAAVTFGLIVSGAVASTSGSSLSCDAWPWCSGREIVPDQASNAVWIDISHRTAALIGTAAVAFVFWQSLRRPVSRAARRMAEIAVGVTLLQVLIGGAYVVTAGSAWLTAAHLAASALLWAAMVGVLVASRRPADTTVAPISAPEFGFSGGLITASGALQMSSSEGAMDGPAHLQGGAATAALSPVFVMPDFKAWMDTVNAYIALTKPGILTLLLATTLGGMLAGAAAIPPLMTVIVTMIGGALAAGGANALNCFIDRDIDALMGRTKKRGTVTGKISPRAALIFGLSLTVSSVLLLGFLVNWLAAGLALLGNAYYVLVYTKWLKRRTPQNIVIGGAAGAMPPVVGWAAATGNISVAAVLMFAIIYYWTPPHFWALALLKQGEYGRAAVPMLPNVAGEEETRWQVLLYTIMLSAVCLMLVPFGFSWIYLIASTALNLIFLGYAVLLYRAPSKSVARRMFFYSLWYLAIIFAAMVADRMILA